MKDERDGFPGSRNVRLTAQFLYPLHFYLGITMRRKSSGSLVDRKVMNVTCNDGIKTTALLSSLPSTSPPCHPNM